MRTAGIRHAFARPAPPRVSSAGWAPDSHSVHDMGSLIWRFGPQRRVVDVAAIEKKTRKALVERYV